MEEVYADLTALGDYLARVQEQRLTRLAFRLEADLSLPQMHRALDMLLPMVQRHTRCIRRDRQGYAVTATLGYRTGVRLADAWRTGDLSHLTAEERLTLTCEGGYPPAGTPRASTGGVAAAADRHPGLPGELPLPAARQARLRRCGGCRRRACARPGQLPGHQRRHVPAGLHGGAGHGVSGGLEPARPAPVEYRPPGGRMVFSGRNGCPGGIRQRRAAG